jgi:O-antigen ligase
MRLLLLYASLPLVFLIGVIQPFWGLLIYMSINIVRPEMFFWGAYRGALIFRVSIVATLLGFILKRDTVLAPLSLRESWLLLWIALAVMASLYFAVIPLHPRAWEYAEEFFKLFLLGWFILGLVVEKEQILKFEDVLLGVASLLAIWGWDQHFRGNERLEGLGGGAFGDSNGVAAFAILFFPLALHKLLSAQDLKQRLFGFVSTVLIGILIVFTESRGGLLGLLACVIFLFWLTPKRIKMFFTLTVVVLLGLPFIGQEYLGRMGTISSDQEERDRSAASRPLLWRTGWMIFKDNPIFGVGLLNYPRAKMSYRSAFEGQVKPYLLNYTFHPDKVGHSTWICQLLAEGGLFLAIPYLWLIFGFFWKTHRVHRARPPNQNTQELHNLLSGLQAGIFGHCVSLSFIDGLLGIFLPIQLIAGMQIIRAIERESGNILPGKTTIIQLQEDPQKKPNTNSHQSYSGKSGF